MMKVTQKENKHIKEKEPQRKFSRKVYAPKKTSHHQMKMKSVIVRQEVEDSNKEDSDEEYEEAEEEYEEVEEEIEEAEVDYR